MEAFGKLPNVRTRFITDTDTNNNHGVLMVQADDPRLGLEQNRMGAARQAGTQQRTGNPQLQ